MGVMFLFLPLFLIVGPAITDISVSLIGLSFLIISFIKRDYSFIKSKLIIFFLCWNFYLIINSLLSINPYLSLQSSLFYFRFIFFSLGIAYILEHKIKYLKFFLFVLSICFLSLIIDGFFQVLNKKNILGYEIVGTRITSFFKDELILGSYLSRLFPIFFGMIIFFYNKNFIVILLGFISFILIDILTFLSGERSALFYLLISSIFIIFFMKEWKYARIATLLLSFVTIFSISYINSSFKERVVNYTVEQIFDTNQKLGFNIFSPQHQVIYETSFKIFKDNPVFGIGAKNFRYVCDNKKYHSYTDLDASVNGCQTSSHNYYIQILTETGIVGFVFVCILIFLYLRLVIKKINEKNNIYNNFFICLMSAILITVWPFVPTGNFFNNWISAIHYLPLGMIIFIKNRL